MERVSARVAELEEHTCDQTSPTSPYPPPPTSPTPPPPYNITAKIGNMDTRIKILEDNVESIKSNMSSETTSQNLPNEICRIMEDRISALEETATGTQNSTLNPSNNEGRNKRKYRRQNYNWIDRECEESYSESPSNTILRRNSSGSRRVTSRHYTNPPPPPPPQRSAPSSY
ncbi:hypothetical protein Pcinc_018054 [Petrolisthes cinctipes]|uniref:Uncharacterized protein n=1 Tax=Petrolisthes cinctipes TaxID=88211 RepID=A0AAE1FN31_PETCI|nr:hypothetical protein Pcinc_018054 [Petrolisthes cinctipes]